MPMPRMVEWKGQQVALNDLARRYGLQPETVKYRLRQGYSLEKALTTPSRGVAGAAKEPMAGSLSRGSLSTDETRERLDADAQRETAPPWEQHPQPWDNVVPKPASAAPKTASKTAAPVAGLGELLEEMENVLLATVELEKRRNRMLNKVRRWRQVAMAGGAL